MRPVHAGAMAASPSTATAFVLAAGILLSSITSTARADNDTVLNSFFGQPNIGAWNPPDPNGACGPRGLLHVNNDRLKYLQKDGTSYYNVQFRDFFPPPTSPNILNDPRALYDPQSERFFLTCSDFAASGGPSSALRAYLNVAVSTSSHPSAVTDWIKYRLDVTQVVGSGGNEQHYAPDYPSIGIDEYGLHVCGNFSILPLDALSTFRDVGIMTFPKDQLLAGGPVSPLVTYLPTGVGFTLQPVSVFWTPAGPGGVTYFVETPSGGATAVRLWALSDPLGARSLASALISVPDHGFTRDWLAPQPGTAIRLRTWSGMAQGVAQWRDGSIWFVATGDTSSPGVGVDRTRVHYYKLAPNGFPSGAPALAETGVFDGGPGVWNYLPALGLTPRGDIGIVFQQSSTLLTPRMIYAARPLDAPAFAPVTLVKASTQAYTYADFGSNAKWGDDYTVTADPADSSLWMSCELVRSPQTGTDVLWIHEWANILFDDDPLGWPMGGRRIRQGQTHVDGVSVARDDSAGAYLGWYDQRPVDDLTAGILGQRLLPSGRRAGGWTANGTSVGPASLSGLKGVVTDAAGGAYFVFISPLSVMRLGRAGEPPPGWPPAPVQVAGQVGPQVGCAADGVGGLLIAYTLSGLRAQHVGPAGDLLWSSPPLIASSAAQPDVVSDSSGGAYVTWTSGGHVRVQHVLTAGGLDPAWPGIGLDLGSGAIPRLVADAAGGVFVVYGSAGNILARRLLSTGVPAPGWTDSFRVCDAVGPQDQLTATPDGSGGVLVAWSDSRSAAEGRDIFVQRVTGQASLVPGWTSNGIRICGAVGDQISPVIANDGSGGAVLAWTDYRSQPECSGAGCGSDCYWSRLTAGGVVETALGIDGAMLAAEIGDQSNPSLALVGSGTAIAAWLDGRSTPDGDPDFLTQLFAARLQFDVTAPASVPDLALRLASCTSIEVSWTAPGDDGAAGTAATYDLRRSSAPIDAGNFTTATPLATGVPKPPGSAEAYTFDFGSCSGPIYFALEARDDVGNTSALSNLPPWISTWCAPPDCELGLEPSESLRDELGVPRPNPTRNMIELDVSVSGASAGLHLDCAVYDVAGRLVKRLLAEQEASSGRRALKWDLRDRSGRTVGRGLYFVRLKLGDRVLSQTVTVR